MIILVKEMRNRKMESSAKNKLEKRKRVNLPPEDEKI